MNLTNKRVLFAAQYAAPYEGNFLVSLMSLEDILTSRYGCECAYLLPAKASRQQWAAGFTAGHRVFFSGDSTSLIRPDEADRVLSEFQPDLVHTHFEGYDIPLYQAVRRSGKSIRQVWHMHDTLAFHDNPLKAAYQTYTYFRHYGLTMLRPNWGG